MIWQKYFYFIFYFLLVLSDSPVNALKVEKFSPLDFKQDLDLRINSEQQKIENFTFSWQNQNSQIFSLSNKNELVFSQNIDNNNIELNKQLQIFPISINVNQNNIIKSSFVKGYQKANQAINFDDWLIPFQDVTKALNLTVTPLASGELELRHVNSVIIIKPEQLQQDADLGLVISVAQIKNLLQIPTEFDLTEYALVLKPPWLQLKEKKNLNLPKTPIVLEELPQIKPPSLSISTLRQDINLARRNNEDFTTQSNLTAIGNLFNGSWFMSFRQPDLTKTTTWQLSELQYLIQSDKNDYVVGSQPTFWASQGGGDYWGFTTIQRFGDFQPQSLSGNGFNPNLRRQSKFVNRTISGEAPAGTLVQLTTDRGNTIIEEILVDSSGVYTFDNLPTPYQQLKNFTLLLYPQGNLSAVPEIREVNYTNLQGQLSKGDSALIISGGMSRQFVNNNLIGDFTDFRAGISYRFGLTDEIAVGLGVVGDQSMFGLAEVFYQPTGIPLKIGLSSLLGNINENSRIFNADIELDFAEKLRLTMQLNEDFQSFNLSTGFIPSLTLRAGGNTINDTLFTGISFSKSFPNFYIATGFDIDTNNNMRWTLNSRYDKIQLNIRGNQNSFNSELTYYLSQLSNYGHSLILGYESSKNNNNQDYLGSLSWRYVSQTKYGDGRNLWDMRLGYGIGSQGNGLRASISTPIIPGLNFELLYEQISLTSNDSRFRLRLLPNINIYPEIAPADFNSNNLRSEGGIIIQPFFDNNNNGKRDKDEAIYTDNPELLLLINEQNIKSLRPFVTNQGIFIRLIPNTYRLELNSAGYPLNWHSIETAYAVEVVAGVYTQVNIPLIKN